MLGHDRVDEDCVSHVVVGNNDILVITLCMDGEVTRVLRVQATEQQFALVDEVALQHRGCCVTGQRAAVCMRLRGMHVLL